MNTSTCVRNDVQAPLHLRRSRRCYGDLVLASLPAAVCGKLHPLAGGISAVCALYGDVWIAR
jgi:hypothetical protein